MNLRSLVFRTAFVVAVFGFALAIAAFAPPANAEPRPAESRGALPLAFPLIGLPVLHALLSP